jgi:hypothetical protein
MLGLPPPDPGIEIILASQGMAKGLRQTDGPQTLVRPEIAFGPAFVGAYAKNVSSPTSDGEAGAQIGVRTRAGGFDVSASAGYKRALAAADGFDDEALEISAAVDRRIGALTPRVSLLWSPDELGGTGRSAFAEAGATLRLAAHTNASAVLGRRERDGGPDYFAFNAGLSQTLAGRITIDLRYYDTDRSGLGEVFRARLVGSVRARF